MFASRLYAVLLFVCTVWGLRFELQASQNDVAPQCVREFVSDGQLVVVTVNTNGHVNDGQILSLSITDAEGNEYRKNDNVNGNFKVAFNAKETSSFDICFTNRIRPGYKSRNNGPGKVLATEIELEIEAGSMAREWNAVQAAEKLKPSEVQLRKIEEIIDDIIDQMQYLQAREERLRDTNESTNRRVRNFFVLSVIVLLSIGSYQIVYLRNYFRSKHIL
ncbi:Erv25 protein [Martiniozyma asiatica (nom. inval.)]|nr:Erv25 protein [Martiniozyma asiatica]